MLRCLGQIKRARRCAVVVLALFALLIVLSACTSQPPTTGEEESATAEQETVRIGAVPHLTGPFAPIGEQQVRGIEFAVKEVNDSGGVLGKKVELTVVDGQGTTEGVLRAVERLVRQDDIKFITGVCLTPDAIAVAHAIGEWGGLLTVGATKSTKVTGEELTRYIFRPGHTDMQEILTVKEFIKNGGLKDAKRWYAIGADYEWGHSVVGEFKKMAPEFGLDIIGEVYVPTTSKDYSAYIVDIAAKKPDAVWIALSGTNALDFLNQAIDFGLSKTTILFGVTSLTDMVVDALGEKAIGLVGTSEYYWTLDNPANKQFVEAWLQVYDHPPTAYEMEEYLAAKVIFEAMKKAGTTEDVEAVIDALEGLKFSTPHGPELVEMRAGDHQAMLPTYIGEVVKDERSKSGVALKIIFTASPEQTTVPLEQTGSPLINQRQ